MQKTNRFELTGRQNAIIIFQLHIITRVHTAGERNESGFFTWILPAGIRLNTGERLDIINILPLDVKTNACAVQTLITT